MGAIESTEAGNIWESTAEEIARGIDYREDESYREYRYEEEPSVHAEEAPVAAASPSPARRAASPSPAAEPATTAAAPVAAAAANESEITTEAEAPPERPVEVSSSKSQKPNRIAPAEVKSNDRAEVIRVSRRYLRNKDVIFAVLFVLHLLLVTTGIIFLNVVYLKDMNERKLHNLQRWFPQLGAAVLAGSLFASLWQTLFRIFPYFMSHAVLWASCVLTFTVSIMLISTSLPANLGVGVILLLLAICLSLYACWVSNRMKYAGNLLACSLKTAINFRGVYLVSLWILLVASFWLIFWSFGVVSALTFKFAALIILALIVSLAWTLETLRNVVYTTVARGVARLYLDGQSAIQWEHALHATFTSLFGSVCLGSLIVPNLHSLRVLARGVSKIHRENDFMFSWSGGFLGIMTALERHANNWAYVQVGVYNKPFVKASEDTWKLFKSKQLNVVIETDMTSSLCVLSGIAGGMLCAIVSGGWTVGTHKALTLSISVLSFFIGYFLVRITMAVPQGAVSTHYVCYAENSTGSEFLTSPVEERLKELLLERENVATEV